MFLMSLVAIASLGVIAGGSFWTAQSMYRVTSNDNNVRVILCGSATPPPSTAAIDYVANTEWRLTALPTGIGVCP
jgi:hypothetical protein